MPDGSISQDSDGRQFGVTESAAKRIAFLLTQESDPEQFMRVAVEGGGCSGFQYIFEFDKEATGEDLQFERDGVKVVVDEVSLDLLNGAELDYVEELLGSYFQVVNPNAASSCGCGTSFSI